MKDFVNLNRNKVLVSIYSVFLYIILNVLFAAVKENEHI